MMVKAAGDHSFRIFTAIDDSRNFTMISFLLLLLEFGGFLFFPPICYLLKEAFLLLSTFERLLCLALRM